MKKFIVSRREVWISPVRIEDESERAAVKRVADDEGEVLQEGFEYSHTLDPEYWTVEECE